MRILIDPINTVINKGSPVFGSLDAVLRLRRAKCDVRFVLKKPDETIYTWLRQHGYTEDKFSREFPREVIIIDDPSIIRADVMVSTVPEQLRGFVGILFHSPDNQSITTVSRAYDWQSVLNRINERQHNENN